MTPNFGNGKKKIHYWRPLAAIGTIGAWPQPGLNVTNRGGAQALLGTPPPAACLGQKQKLTSKANIEGGPTLQVNPKSPT